MINELPAEILQTIFELVLGKPCRNPASNLEAKIQDKLCSVCHLWRNITLQDPFLWNTIHFLANEAAIKRAERSIQLSGNAPLDIYMTALKSYERLMSAELTINSYGTRFIELIEAHSHRWRMLEVEYPSLILDFRPLWNGQAPILERLVVSWWASSTVPSPPSLMPGSDKLTSLTISQFGLHWGQWSCTSITHLTLGPFGPMVRAPTGQELYNILFTISDRLCSFTIRGSWSVAQDETLPEDPVILKALTSLTISTRWDPSVQQALCMCRFPSLIQLDTYVSLFGILPPQLTRLLTKEPKLFQAVKHITIGGLAQSIGPISGVSMSVVLQSAFPRVHHVQLAPYMTLEGSIVNVLGSSWASMTRLDLSEADLPQVVDLLSTRVSKGLDVRLRELNIHKVRGLLYREDYARIHSQVDRFTISKVRPESRNQFMLNREVIPFDEKLLIAQAPAQRPARGPMQTRAL